MHNSRSRVTVREAWRNEPGSRLRLADLLVRGQYRTGVNLKKQKTFLKKASMTFLRRRAQNRTPIGTVKVFLSPKKEETTTSRNRESKRDSHDKSPFVVRSSDGS